jgi:ABC-type branched-subunit amino acid transport system permease subunit
MLVAIPAIRVKGIYLALATFGFGILMVNLVYGTSLMFGTGSALVANRPRLGLLNLASDRSYFYVVIALSLLAAVAMLSLQRSRLGRLLRGLSDSSLALTTFGVSVNTTLVIVFGISAFLAGIGGAVLASGTHAAGPADYGALNSLEWVVVLAISGRNLIRSAVVAAILLAVVPAYLPQSWINYEPIGFGVLAIITALLVSNGFDLPALVKADLTSSVRLGSRSPVLARFDAPERPVALRRRPVPALPRARQSDQATRRVLRSTDVSQFEAVQ